MAAPSPAYFLQRHFSGYAIYDERGPVLGYEDIDCLASAEAHIADLTEADRLRDEQEAAQLAADHAEADAMAFSLVAPSARAA